MCKSLKDGLTDIMTWLGSKPDTIFVGQALRGGTFQSQTLDNVEDKKLLEFPVSESFNVQFAMGLALAHYVPIVIIPRMDFLLLATGDIINMLDKFYPISGGKVNPKVLIRTALGPNSPVDPGAQHQGDYRNLWADHCKYVKTYFISNAEEAELSYKAAYYDDGPSILIENGKTYYDE